MSFSLDLRQCETLVLNLAEDVERRESVVDLCERLGLSYQLIDALKCSPGRIGCGLSHLKALRQADPTRPTLVLEDDIAITEDFAAVLTVPDDADAVYLGVSAYGAVEMIDYIGFTGRLLADEASDGLMRVYNLLAAHATVYLTERYRRAAIEAIVESIVDRDWDPDRGLAMIQADFNVYAVQHPAFYQAAALQTPSRAQSQEDATRVVLEPSRIGAVEPIFLGEVAHDIRIERQDGRLKWVWAGAEPD
jgi:hypothetical protein